MGGNDVRSIKPDELERLAGLMDHLSSATDEMFKQASHLGVSSFFNLLREMPGWGSRTAKELKQRAAIGRLQTGDPFAGLAWAGFSPKEIAAGADKLSPETLVGVNTVTAWASATGHADLERRPKESLDDYVKRQEAAVIGHYVPALRPHEATVAEVLKAVGDYRGVAVTIPVVTGQSVALGRLMLNNHVSVPLSQQAGARAKNIEFLGKAYSRTVSLSGKNKQIADLKLALRTRSATSPGTGVAALTRRLFMKSGLYRDYVSRLPEYMEMDRISNAAKVGRQLAGARVNKLIDGLFGNNELAKKLGSTTHSGQAVQASGEANLLKVWKATGDPGKMAEAAKVLKTEPAALSRVGTVARTAGALRTLGVAGGVASTLYSGANVVSQGNPVDAFKRNGAGYVADVAELGFNASLTAAMVCPNPLTIGASVAFGTVYVGAKVVEHWDAVKDGAKKAVTAIGDGAKKVLSSLNPFD
ncbi:hypothetical protein AB0395_00810 [Streptosporangium sp. NPDC051023]|uniref:hypothetical protein n=1 Tax=Streptosporangium sp. NPDC051023 TaxID=3155410 RepID=UPI00344D5390